MKQSLKFSGMVLAFSLITTPVIAANVDSATIACVGTAVTTREAALGAAVAVHAQAVAAAYSTRATELSGAYSNTMVKTLKPGIKVSWADFNKSVKSASEKWKTSKNAAWATFRTAVKACKATSEMTDASNSASEVSGQ